MTTTDRELFGAVQNDLARMAREARNSRRKAMELDVLKRIDADPEIKKKFIDSGVYRKIRNAVSQKNTPSPSPQRNRDTSPSSSNRKNKPDNDEESRRIHQELLELIDAIRQ